MLATRKLDLKLIEKLLPQLENEEAQAEIELEQAEKAVYQARTRRDEAREFVLQMRGEYDLAQGSTDASVESETKEDNPTVSPTQVWNNPGFSWRQYLPELILAENIPMTFNDVKTRVGVTEEKFLDSTISSALSHLAKHGTLLSSSIPGVRGVFYGLPSFFDGDELKEEYLKKVNEKLGRTFYSWIVKPDETSVQESTVENE